MSSVLLLIMQKHFKMQQVTFVSASSHRDFFSAAFERTGRVNCGEGTDPEEVEATEDLEGAPLEEASEMSALEEAISQLKSRGIFAVRCAAHSLQVFTFLFPCRKFSSSS